MQKFFIFIAIAMLFANAGVAQDEQSETPGTPEISEISETPKFAVKTNALYWLTTTINLGIETKLSPKLSLDVSVNFNPWKLGENIQFKHLMIQPELRYWIDKPFTGHFLGFHGHYADYNVGLHNINSGITITDIKHFRKAGHLFGIGASYGYQVEINSKWRLEGVIGLGYAHLNYLVYDKSGAQIMSDKGSFTHYYNWFGPTKLAFNMIYVIK